VNLAIKNATIMSPQSNEYHEGYTDESLRSRLDIKPLLLKVVSSKLHKNFAFYLPSASKRRLRTTLIFVAWIISSENESAMSGTLLDLIPNLGTPSGLFPDNAKEQIRNTAKSLLRTELLEDMQLEPHHQHQNASQMSAKYPFTSLIALVFQFLLDSVTPPSYHVHSKLRIT
jgi:hypothetical protein